MGWYSDSTGTPAVSRTETMTNDKTETIDTRTTTLRSMSRVRLKNSDNRARSSISSAKCRAEVAMLAHCYPEDLRQGRITRNPVLWRPK